MVTVTAFAVVLCASCGAGQAPSGRSGAGTGEGGASSWSSGVGAAGSGSVALSVGSVASPAFLPGYMPAAGRYFLTVDTTLHDVSTPAPIPVGSDNYSLVTKNGLALATSGASDLVLTPCASDTSVVPGAQYTCTVVFEVPIGDAPAQLLYDDKHGDSATAPVSYMPPAPPSGGCDTFVKLPGTNVEACVQCTQGAACDAEWKMLQDELGDGHTCPTFGTDCQSCSMDGSSPGFCGCWDGCLGACQPAFEAYYECLVAKCYVACG
jgi:hypothetical protein